MNVWHKPKKNLQKLTEVIYSQKNKLNKIRR